MRSFRSPTASSGAYHASPLLGAPLEHLPRRLPSFPRPLRPRRLFKRLGIVICLLFLWEALFASSRSSSSDPLSSPSPLRRLLFSSSRPDQLRLAPDSPHPISHRLQVAAERWEAKISRQSKTYPDFVQEYIRRYDLPPPPGMEKWFERVTKDGHQLVDEYDGMMEELKPFRAMGRKEVLRRTLEISQMPTFSLLNVRTRPPGGGGADARSTARSPRTTLTSTDKTIGARVLS